MGERRRIEWISIGIGLSEEINRQVAKDKDHCLPSSFVDRAEYSATTSNESGLPEFGHPFDITDFYSDSVVTYSDVEGGRNGEGNIRSDPLFLGGGDYHLTASSPCIDSGTSNGAPSTDIEGNLRPNGHGYDMGAYEYRYPPPAITTHCATSVTSSSATLNGEVNPGDTSTFVWFEYGISTSYGSSVTASQSPLSGTTSQTVSADLTGLMPNSTYHFRAYATNSAATAYGSDFSFRTSYAATQIAELRNPATPQFRMQLTMPLTDR